MAFDSTKTSLRLNHIPAGLAVVLYDFGSKKPLATATMQGWNNAAGEAIAAPKKMKAMDDGTTVTFVNVASMVEGKEVPETLTLVREPGSYGAMFMATTKGEGEDAKTTYRRLTAYAETAAVAKMREEEQAAKAAEAAAAEVKEVAEAPETVEPAKEEPVAEVEAPAKPKRQSRKKAETKPEVVETTEA